MAFARLRSAPVALRFRCAVSFLDGLRFCSVHPGSSTGRSGLAPLDQTVELPVLLRPFAASRFVPRSAARSAAAS